MCCLHVGNVLMIFLIYPIGVTISLNLYNLVGLRASLSIMGVSSRSVNNKIISKFLYLPSDISVDFPCKVFDDNR